MFQNAQRLITTPLIVSENGEERGACERGGRGGSGYIRANKATDTMFHRLGIRRIDICIWFLIYKHSV